MDFQGTGRDGEGVNGPAEMGGHPPVAPTNTAGIDFGSRRSSIPPAPFFQGFHGMGSQMPFMFPHPFMPPPGGHGFSPTAHNIRTPPLTSQVCHRSKHPKSASHSSRSPKRNAEFKRKNPTLWCWTTSTMKGMCRKISDIGRITG